MRKLKLSEPGARVVVEAKIDGRWKEQAPETLTRQEWKRLIARHSPQLVSGIAFQTARKELL